MKNFFRQTEVCFCTVSANELGNAITVLLPFYKYMASFSTCVPMARSRPTLREVRYVMDVCRIRAFFSVTSIKSIGMIIRISTIFVTNAFTECVYPSMLGNFERHKDRITRETSRTAATVQVLTQDHTLLCVHNAWT